MKGEKTVLLRTYLTFDKSRVLGVRKSKPNLRAGEYAVRIELRVPASLFLDEPPVATIEVPERQVFTPTVAVAADA